MNGIVKPRTRLRRGERFIAPIFFAVIMALLAAQLQVTAQTTPDWRFGAVEAFRSPNDARELNLGWERILFYWSEMQPSGPDDWNIFHVEDGWISTAAAQGRQVIGLLENTPRWATDGANQIGVPRGLELPVDDPNNLWAAFVRKVVKRYAGRIDHWIIWNEPDIEPPDDGIQWGGTVADYYQLVKVAYLAAKLENPNAVIHLAGLTWHHDVVHKRVPYLQRFINEAKKDPTAAANNYYFDVGTFHVYLTTDSVYDILQALYGVLRRNGLKHPIWINETNSPPSHDPLNPWRAPTFVTSLDQQADFLIHAFALGLAGGAQRIAVYKLIDIPAYPEGHPAFGLVRADSTRRPAYEAMKVITTYFRNTRSAKLVRTGSTEVVTLDRNGATTRVAWARGNTSANITLPAFADEGLIVALDGSTHSIKAVNGQYKLTLPGAKCDDPNYSCRVGGHPIVLVENEVTDPSTAATIQVSTATPPPEAATTTAGETATSVPTDTPTPSATPCPDCTPTPTSTPRPSDTPTPTETLTATLTSQPSETPASTATSQPTATLTPTPVVIAQKNPMPTFIPTRALSTAADGPPAELIVPGLAASVAVVVGALGLYLSRKKK
ncbi:hypothetical protein TFLX_03683 [Thermoflexales bacterium]|nr:hypothetical protein TFLX_03683 [Thermoflexales bacterium]